MSHSYPPKHIAVAIELHWNLPWHLDCYQGIVDYGQEQGWNCVTDPYLSGATGDRNLSQYDGAIGRIDSDMAMRVSEAGLAAVTLLYHIGLHSVRSDAMRCAQLAGEHLVACGYRHIAHVGSLASRPEVSKTIFDAFSNSVTKLSNPEPIDAAFDPDDLAHPVRCMAVRQALAEWIQNQPKPIGLYIQEMATARYLTQICTQLGLRVPQDVGILVHSADKLTATSITPTLSEVAIDHWEQGYQAAAVLDRLMRGEQVEPKTRYISDPRIITRESTDAFISEDEMISEAMRFITAQCRQAISAEDVANQLQVSRRTLDRRFEKVRGKTVSQEISEKRLEQIQSMLIESEITMVVLSELFSFGSASQFTQFFKKHVNVTPTDYRKQYRHKT